MQVCPRLLEIHSVVHQVIRNLVIGSGGPTHRIRGTSLRNKAIIQDTGNTVNNPLEKGPIDFGTSESSNSAHHIRKGFAIHNACEASVLPVPCMFGRIHTMLSRDVVQSAFLSAPSFGQMQA